MPDDYYEWTRTPGDGVVTYEAEFDDNALTVYVGKVKSEENSWRLSFKVNDFKNVMTGLGNFYKLFETVFRIIQDCAETLPDCDRFSFYLDQRSVYGQKARPIYERLLQSKWIPWGEEAGWKFIGAIEDDVNDLMFTWEKKK
jgi:hypothetical protein